MTDYSAREFLPPTWHERVWAGLHGPPEEAPAPSEPPGIPLQRRSRGWALPLRHTRACLQRLGDLDGCDGGCRPRTERLEAS